MKHHIHMHMSTAYFHYNEISYNIVIYNTVFLMGIWWYIMWKKQIDWGYNGYMTGIDQNMKDIPTGKHTKNYWTWPFVVSFPIEHGDFP